MLAFLAFSHIPTMSIRIFRIKIFVVIKILIPLAPFKHLNPVHPQIFKILIRQ
jgi:hypothetical protein